MGKEYIEKNDDEIKVNVTSDNGHSEEYADDFYDENEVKKCHCEKCECEDCHCDDCDCDNCDCENCHCEDCDCGCCDCECDCDECHCDCECDCHCCCHEMHEYDEEILPETLIEDFSPSIVERGEEYYDDGNVISVHKVDNRYYAKVLGHDNKEYGVMITVYNEEDADYCCDCPCEYPCKHAYATLIAIAEGDYDVVKLKEKVSREIASLEETIEKIPADELKKYMLSDEGLDNISVNMKAFNEHFRNYLPQQSYEYYYNNLYNSLVLDDGYENRIDDYLSDAREYLKDNNFSETFKIVKSIIEAYYDSQINEEDELDLLNKLGMLLRIVYRKADENTKKDVLEWQDKLKKDNYYNNYYLEDVILSLK